MIWKDWNFSYIHYWSRKGKKNVFLMVKAHLRLHSWHLRDKTPLNVDAQGLYTKPCSFFRIPQSYLHIFCQSWCKELQCKGKNWGAFASCACQLYIWFYTLLVNKPFISKAMNWFFTENLQCYRKVNFLNAIYDFGLIWPAFSKKCKKYGGGIAITKNKNVKSGLTTLKTPMELY